MLSSICFFVVVFLKEKVVINFNKLHADPKQGKSLDIGMKICIFYRSRNKSEYKNVFIVINYTI